MGPTIADLNITSNKDTQTRVYINQSMLTTPKNQEETNSVHSQSEERLSRNSRDTKEEEEILIREDGKQEAETRNTQLLVINHQKPTRIIWPKYKIMMDIQNWSPPDPSSPEHTF